MSTWRCKTASMTSWSEYMAYLNDDAGAIRCPGRPDILTMVDDGGGCAGKKGQDGRRL